MLPGINVGAKCLHSIMEVALHNTPIYLYYVRQYAHEDSKRIDDT